ncbi:MAG TPA: 4Fe-4S dicluster domain-containing protein, partial [Syntrophorhabdaceae bacterium]|nr:4Fe-4S dicluster domain-containing protein [Syntrophorhabdaceae bacterium]
WEGEFDRCIRCYACRNACPMCVCQDSCIAETRDPHWISQRATLSEKFMFHMIHALHLAGRCVECGECERVCPMNIPVNKLKRKINLDMKELYNYEPGVNPEDKPPMYTFNVDEVTIKEHKI